MYVFVRFRFILCCLLLAGDCFFLQRIFFGGRRRVLRTPLSIRKGASVDFVFSNVFFRGGPQIPTRSHIWAHGAKHSPPTSPHEAPSGQSGGSSCEYGLDPFDQRFSPSNERISKKSLVLTLAIFDVDFDFSNDFFRGGPQMPTPHHIWAHFGVIF